MNRIIAYILLITGLLLVFLGGSCSVFYIAILISDITRFGVEHVIMAYLDVIALIMFLLPFAMIFAGYFVLKKAILSLRQNKR